MQREFATNVLHNLLNLIEGENRGGGDTYVVAYAWTDGPIMYLVYEAPPSDIVWGLVRDTRESIIDPAPWPDLDEAVRYYYLLDLEENRMSASFPNPGQPDTIFWRGDQHPDLPERPSDIPESHRYEPPQDESAAPCPPDRGQRVVNEPRRYVDPRDL